MNCADDKSSDPSEHPSPRKSISTRKRRRRDVSESVEETQPENGEEHLNSRLRSRRPKCDANEWNSFFCCLCGAGGDIVCCDTCPMSYHLICLAKNPQLASLISEGLLNDSTTTIKGDETQNDVKNNIKSEEAKNDASNDEKKPDKWSCPKCHFISFEEVKLSAAKKPKFNYAKWLQNTSAVNFTSAGETVDVLAKYGRGVALPQISPKRKKKGETARVSMSQLEEDDFSNCLIQLADVRS